MEHLRLTLKIPKLIRGTMSISGLFTEAANPTLRAQLQVSFSLYMAHYYVTNDVLGFENLLSCSAVFLFFFSWDD